MTAIIIDGKEIAKDVREECKEHVDELKKKGVTPGLAVIIVGDNPVSRMYINNKIIACKEVGLHSEVHEMPSDTSEKDLLEKIQDLNSASDIHGILVQLPLPEQIDNDKVLEKISVNKDVDGFHLYNMGALVVGSTVFPPCTPYGIKCLLERINVPIEGQHAVVVGRSNIVGKPMALMLLQMNATVTVCTSKTRDLANITNLADILVVATGKPKMITADMVKEGAIVIDVGINRLEGGRLVGDVDFDAVKDKAAYITPVPGGVGPMTTIKLVVNTIQAAQRSSILSKQYQL